MTAPPSLNALRVFCEVANRGGVTRAAEALGVTQSAVSKQIARLENEMGHKLFERRYRSLRLTAYGAEVADAAQSAFDHLDDRLAAIGGASPGQINFHGDADFIQLWLAPRLARFEDQNPDLRVSLFAVIGMNQPPEGSYDCAVIWGRGFWKDCRYEPFLANAAFPVAAPDFFAGLGRPPRIEDVAERDMIHDQSRLWSAGFGRTPGDGSFGARAGRLYNQTALCLAAASRGEGVTVGDEVSSRGYLEEGRLVLPFPLRRPSLDSYYLLSPSGRPASPKIDRFIAWMREEAAEHRQWCDGFWAARDNA